MKMDAISQLHKKLFSQQTTLKGDFQFLLFLTTISFLLCINTNFSSSSSSINRLTDLALFNDKKAMFFLCNIILLLVAKDTGLLGYSQEQDLHQQIRPPKAEVLEIADLVVEGKVELDSRESKSLELVVVKGEEREELNLVENVEEDDDIDELNKRVEEFIEKVKRERRMEAMQLVLV